VALAIGNLLFTPLFLWDTRRVMKIPFAFVLLSMGLAAGTVACSSSNGGPGDAGTATDAAGGTDATSTSDGASPSDAGPGADSPSSQLTTIAAAITGNVTTPITVQAIVTAEHGTIPTDVSEWYIEDLDGGPHSGVVVYCDPDKTSCPSIRAPGRWTVVQMTGSLSPYKGQMEFIPTAQTVISDAGAPPPVPSVAMTDVAPGGNSQYRGVLVQITSGTTLTVDDVTPAALVDTSCTTVVYPDAGVPADAGDAGDAVDAAGVDAGPGTLECSPVCEPPAYSGFTANDGSGNEVNIEASFYATDPLQSSPECLTQPGVTPVTVGMKFSAMQGVLDYDPYASQQAISPVTPSDYTIQ
jgi:hypothetical protein